MPTSRSLPPSDRTRDGAPGAPAPGAPPPAAPRARARSVDQLVAPLIGDTLALQRRMADWSRRGVAGVAAPELAAVFADQLRASAALLAGCVRRGGAAPAAAARGGPRLPAAAGGDRTAVVRRLLADEEAVALRLRQTIAVCDGRHDERTADRLEEVLDEIERQRRVLGALLGGGA
jgi:hypothetical protein